MKKTKIVIVGGGFAGLAAATYLNERLAAQIITLRDGEELTSRMTRIRAQAASDGSSRSKRLNEVMLN